jgi:hypothetical protein
MVCQNLKVIFFIGFVFLGLNGDSASADLRSKAEEKQLVARWHDYFRDQSFDKRIKKGVLKLATHFLSQERTPIEELLLDSPLFENELENPAFRSLALKFVLTTWCETAKTSGDQVISRLLSRRSADQEWGPFNSTIEELLQGHESNGLSQLGLCPEYFKSLMESVFLTENDTLQRKALDALRVYQGPYLYDLYLYAVQHSRFKSIRSIAIEEGVEHLSLRAEMQTDSSWATLLKEISMLHLKLQSSEVLNDALLQAELKRVYLQRSLELKRVEASAIDRVMIGSLYLAGFSDISKKSAGARLKVLKDSFFLELLNEFPYLVEAFVRDYQYREMETKNLVRFFGSKNLSRATKNQILLQYQLILNSREDKKIRLGLANSATFPYLIQAFPSFKRYFLLEYWPTEVDLQVKEAFSVHLKE